ncbi:cell division regulator GpsB [Bacillus sp. 165]|uniref:cell division regulator GpsB n=1 Tax=Bacillus sp. 165 TaxID=1529117 RepID=UPI001ADAF765|nr:cell division regulator GpsB [Bacillus sp. 165]MBO9128199.1 cell division regulator GpsB [Bacillus sp. 165]
MLSEKLKLSAKEILEKEFKTGLRGYQQEEVDKFLDYIIKDYETFHQIIEELQQENVRMKRKMEEQKRTVDTQPQKPVAAPPVYGNTNPDILRRLSNLEKHVFGSKLYD